MYKSNQQCHKIRRILLFSFVLILFSSSLIYTDLDPNPNVDLYEIIKSQDISSDLQQRPPQVNTKLNNFYENASVNAAYYSDPFESYLLFTMEKRNLTTNKGIASTVAITDLNGTLIASKEIDQTTLNSLGLGISSCSAEMVNSTTVLYGNPNATLWNFETNTSVSLGFFGHHELEYISTRDSIFVLEQSTRIIDDKLIVTDNINEYDLNSNLIWSLDSYDFVGSQKHCPFISYTAESLIDVTHGNTIFYDEEEDVLYYNSRNLNTFYKIDYVTKNVIWSLGEYGDFTLYDKYGTIQSNLFYHAHSVEKTADKTFILFDNDRHNQTFAHSRTSRIVELVIDDTTMIAKESFTWEAPESYWSSIWGDADMLPNGHFFGTFGTPTHVGSGIGARMVEVNRAGDLIWELNYEWEGDDISYGIYRAERFRYQPTILKNEDVLVTPKDEVFLSLETFYNFRTRSNVQGSYEVFLNGSIVDSGMHEFEQFWKKSYLNISIGKLGSGFYNLTVVLMDEAGHATACEIPVISTNFAIMKTGPLEIESGQNDANITWSGVTVSSLTYNITVNGSLITADSWDGENINLDLNSLDLGYNLIELQIFNFSILLFDDSFEVDIFPYESPYFYSFADNVELIWNNTSTLSWSIFDNSPNYVYLYLNDTFETKFSWVDKSQLFEWEIPILDEGLYEVKLQAFDRNMLMNEITTLVLITHPSPPIISSFPQDTVYWGIPTILEWEIHGGTNFYLYRNNSLVFESSSYSRYITVDLRDWWLVDWFPGVYNVTLFVEDSSGKTALHFQWIYVQIEFGDAYANEFLASNSFFYYSGESAVGSADGEFAMITMDYSYGTVTLDMGKEEEILNGEGDDFWVIAEGGEYSVKVSNSLSTHFTFLSYGTGNQSFDLESIGFTEARYVQIVYNSGANIQLDAIEAINYRILKEESDPPYISPHADMSVYNDQSSVEFAWSVNDTSPWNHSIYIDGDLVFSSPWRGSLIITYYLEIPHTGVFEIRLTLYDLFGNFAEDLFLLEILETERTSISLSVFCSVIVITLLLKNIFSRKKRFVQN
ncbi:MAG: hypothetical protein GOP50_11540 [Candidatus Heimdallarchaeota archaeon]|nr:hypothetical protein [Candidatus Heimdallarchaeota archaeon]